MDFLKLLLKRRSIRSYSQQAVDREKLGSIIRAGLLAPSGKNTQPLELIVVEERETLDSLALARDRGSQMLKEASCAIVVLADKDKTDTWIEDASISLSYMQLMASSLDIGTCWVQIKGRSNYKSESSQAYVKNLLGVEKTSLVPLALLSLGLAREEKPPHKLEDIQLDKIHFENFKG